MQLTQNKKELALLGVLNDIKISVIIPTEEAEKYQPDVLLPDGLKLRIFSKEMHMTESNEGIYSEQDLNWKPGIWFLDNIENLYKNSLKTQEDFLLQINNDIEKKKRLKASLPTGTEVIQTLYQSGLLTSLIESKDASAVIGLLIFTLIIPNEQKGIIYLKRILENLKTPLSEVDRSALLEIINNLGVIKS